MVVGAVNEVENNTIHSTAAVIFFVAFDIYMLSVTFSMWNWNGSNSTNMIIKLCISVYGLVALILFAIMSGNWGKWGIEIAICEWTGTIGIILYNMSFVVEYGNELYVGAILHSSTSAPNIPQVVKPPNQYSPIPSVPAAYYPMYTIPAMIPPESLYYPKLSPQETSIYINPAYQNPNMRG